MSDSFIDPTYDDDFEIAEAERLLALVKGTTLQIADPVPAAKSPLPEVETETHHPLSETKTTKITDEEAIRKAKRRRKKLLKQLKAIEKLKDMQAAGKTLNQEQLDKVAKEKEWTVEVELGARG